MSRSAGPTGARRTICPPGDDRFDHRRSEPLRKRNSMKTCGIRERITLAGLAVAMLGTTGTLPAQTIPGRYIAVLKTETRDTPGTAIALAAQHGLQLDHVYTRAIKGFAFGGSQQAAQALARRAEIAYVEPDQVATAFQQTVATGVHRCDADAVPGLITGGGLTVDADVAIIDTGLDGTHPDLNVQPGGVRFYTNRKQQLLTDNNWQDDNGHGTHVGGIVGALDNGIGVVGVAPSTRLWAVKVLDSGGSGTYSMVLAGIDWVVQRATTFEVANMSLGGGKSQAINDAVKAGTGAGIVFVVAAGNSGRDAANYSPASEPTALTVSALDDNDGLPGSLGGLTEWGEYDDTLAQFSNYGQIVDVCAPGVEIYSTYLMSKGGYATMSGTSMASPHAAGAAALYVARHGLTKDAAGVEDVCAAIRDSGWQPGHYAHFCDLLYYEGVLDAFQEPLLNVADLLYRETPATLSIAAPPDATKVVGSTTVEVTTSAGATAVQFYVDGQFIGEDADGLDGWSVTWDTTPSADGPRTLVAVATGGSSQLAGDATLVGVNNAGSQVPSVRIVTPSSDPAYPQTVPVAGTVDLLAQAADLGTVAAVEFYFGNTLIGLGTPGPIGWSLAWNTIQVQDAAAELKAVALGGDGSQGVSPAVPVSVVNKAIHIGDLDRASAASGGQWTATVWVTVHDPTHNPLAGATVSGSWSAGGAAVPLFTDSNGQCMFVSNPLSKKYSSVTFTVTAVTPPLSPEGLHYEPSLNHDPDGDSNGTSISVRKP
jgi:subtilisin family serine protease